jgi:hypothetical protein
MKRRLILSLLIAAAGCKKPAPPEAPVEAQPAVSNEVRHLNWSIFSSGGAEVRQTATAANDCTTTCSVQGAASWSRSECAGLDTDFRFVSNDCGQLLVLFEHPDAQPALNDRIVGSLYLAENDRVPLRLNRFMQSSAGIRVNGKHMMWLAGALGIPGQAPSLSADGTAVEFVTIDKVPHSIPFSALAGWADK